MTITLSPTLTTEMGSLSRRHAAKATVERWLPEWTPKISGLSANKYEQYAHGHAACEAANANGSGEDVLFRARSGSWSDPFDGVLYIAVIKGADLETPENWESKWVSSGQGGLMRPAWYNNVETTPASNGGSIAVAWSGSFFRVFFCHTNGNLYYRDYNTSGGLVTGTTLVASLGTDTYSMASMQIASCNYTEVFVLRTELIEASQASWHKPIYGSTIHRIAWNGSAWSDGPTFPYPYQHEAALVRDSQLTYGAAPNEWGAASAQKIIAQWGKRPCGGLAANDLGDNRVVVSAGFTFWRRYGYDTHNQGILSYIYDRSNGQWERGLETDISDYVDERLDYAVFARGSKIDGKNVLVWTRYVEPSDYDQLEAAMSLPRVREVVYAVFDATGQALTQYEYLGDPQELNCASLVALNHAGQKFIYALGWRSVYQSPPAALLCTVPTPTDLELYCDGWQVTANNRYGMDVDLDVADASVLFQPDSPLQAGHLVKVYAGTPEELTPLGQGRVDLITPAFSLEQESHRAKVAARAEKGLLDPRSEELSEILPQNTVEIEPTDPIIHIGNHAGYWETVKLEWPSKFTEFSGVYSSLNGRLAYRLKSFPYANTGGDQGKGYPGMVLDQRPQHKGTWWNDAAWTDLSPMVDGSIEATVRFGDVNNAGNFHFWDRRNQHLYITVVRSNTMINSLQWRLNSYSNSIVNQPKQMACAAYLMCHAAEMGKKFAFVWEASTTANTTYNSNDQVPPEWIGRSKPFSASSHTDDTWKKENFDRCDFYPYALGANKLYLVESDYDDSDKDWAKNGKWIHKVVAGGIDATGLTPGYPADLKMTVMGGVIYCFYRPTQRDGQPKSQWQFAFSYKAGRFGAGRFGFGGRGHAGIQWDDYYYAYGTSKNPTGRNLIPKYDNYVDFWDIKATDAVMDRPMEEVLRRRCWQGFTPTEFRSLVNEAGPVTGSGTVRAYTSPVENLTINFKMSLSAMGGEGGVICRAVNQAAPLSGAHVRLGLVVNGGLPGAGGTVTSYLVKRVYNASGQEVTAEREYSPFPLYLHNTWPLPIRVTVRGNIYSMWIAGQQAGHFRDSTEGGLYFGLYAVGSSATFTQIYVPELYEVLENSTLEVNQTVFDAIKNMIGKRALKGVFQPTGALKLSYFETHDTGPTLQDTLKQSAVRLSDRFYSIVRVDGAYTWAVYASEVLLKLGRRFMQASFPDIFHREFCYREARNLCIRAAEDQVQTTFTGLPDYRVQPEDKIEVFVDEQNIAGHYLVDDVTHTFRMDQDDPQADMTVSTRRSVVI
ncbi:MAG: hypothetical protein HS114_28630 [Anaerolineales bacterium]|nr:hypothetical protein [Anaerolineales bacterium]